ncbi:cerebellin-3-like [Saccostrea cucullata]|uniref:cerebellin-3-like n=1 Tax=Saccostrea cuccullata TaxID=36930 RepID=UPI002ECFEF67
MSVPSTRGVSFSVSLSSATPKLGTKQTVIYDEVLTNDGDGYDDRTGVFECPVTGTYMFVVDSLSKGTITLGIKVNKEYVVFMHRSGHEHYIQISRTVIVKLNKGDHVKVDSIYMYGYVHPYNYSGFTGTLLY